MATLEVSMMQINPISIKQTNFKGKFQLNKTNRVMKTIASTLPIVSVPIVAYKVNDNKILEEANKPYKPYTTKVKYAQKEFLERGLPCKDEYIDYNTGNLNYQGNSIIRNYDNSKELFKEANLDFRKEIK